MLWRVHQRYMVVAKESNAARYEVSRDSLYTLTLYACFSASQAKCVYDSLTMVLVNLGFSFICRVPDLVECLTHSGIRP